MPGACYIAAVRMRRFSNTERAFLALLFGLAGTLVAVPLASTGLWPGGAPSTGANIERPQTTAADGPARALTADDRELEAALAGLWTRWETREEGAKIRFWYFHGDGKGLYRYGRVGHTNTHSFDYGVRDGRLRVVFRKTGEGHDIDVRIDEDDRGRPRLRLDPDPEEVGARYVRMQAPISAARAEQAFEFGAGNSQMASGPGGRLWIDHRRFATGGAGFDMYQFNAPAIDGRGIGWFHHGDFDDWSTESLTYRIDGDRIQLFFDLREELASSTFELRTEGEQRYLEIRDDPRDYYKSHTYVDAGASFGTLSPALVSPAFDR